MKTMRLTTATLFALGTLAAGACTYDRAPNRVTSTAWVTRDADDRRVVELDPRGASLNEETDPYDGAARPPTAGGPGGDEGGPPGESGLDEEPAADAERVAVDEEPATTAQAEEAPARPRSVDEPEPGDAPLVEEAAPEVSAVADPALRDLARDDPPDEPLIAEGMLRDASCPMELEGARVGVVERREGPALVFQTRDEDDVEELQSRVMALALTKDDERVEEPVTGTRAALADEPGPDVEPPDETHMLEGGAAEMPHNLPTELSSAEQEEAREPAVAGRLTPLPEAEVTVELTDDGAHVLFEPLAEGQRGALTRQLQQRARALREGECPADTMSMLTREPG